MTVKPEIFTSSEGAILSVRIVGIFCGINFSGFRRPIAVRENIIYSRILYYINQSQHLTKCNP